MSDVLSRLDSAIAGLCPCGAEPREGSAYCGDDCTPTHTAGDTTSHFDGTPMRWRPDLVTAAGDDPDLEPVESTGGYAGPFNPQVSRRRSTDVWHLRLDDGHRWVGSDLDAPGFTDEELLDAMTVTWRRLERELRNTRHTVSDPWADVMSRRAHPIPTARVMFAPVNRWGYSGDAFRAISLGPFPGTVLSEEGREAIIRAITEAAERVRVQLDRWADQLGPALTGIGTASTATDPQEDQHPMLRAIEHRRRNANTGPAQPVRPPRQIGPRRGR